MQCKREYITASFWLYKGDWTRGTELKAFVVLTSLAAHSNDGLPNKLWAQREEEL